MNTAILILAAGNSSRLGQPKQLLKFKGKSLLKHVTAQALEVTPYTAVVTGSDHRHIKKEIEDLNIPIVENPDWGEGMGSSVRVGLNTLLNKFPEITKCIVSVCDQPFIEASVFRALISEQESSQKGIVASAYSGTSGTPALFTEKYFKYLSGLSGQEGAKKLLHHFREDTAEISFELGAVDIDTIEDYQRLIQ